MINVKLKQGLNKKIFQRPLKLIRSLKYKNINISIISNNCAGGIIYHDNGKKFLSPTINLFFENEDYILFLENIEDIKNYSLIEDCSNTYPIGKLNIEKKIRIHFLHYTSFNDALLKWANRVKRINFEQLVILFIERDLLTENQYERFKKIKYPKVIVSPYREESDEIIKIEKADLDQLFFFRGLSGKRCYEKYFNLKVLDIIMKRGI